MSKKIFHILSLLLFLLSPVYSEKCSYLEQPEQGFFIGGFCSNSIGSICGIKCKPGFTLYGSAFRKCEIKNGLAIWTGIEPYCRMNQCKQLKLNENVSSNCTEYNNDYGTVCHFKCPDEYVNLGSSLRICLAIGIWSGLDSKCIISNKIQHVQSTSSISPTTMKSFSSQYTDLSQQSLSFGYSFKKISLNVESFDLPLTFSIWLRTNYTKNIKIINYHHSCFNVSILSNENSSLIIDLSFYQDADLSTKSYYFDLHKSLVKNVWTQLIFSHNEQNFRIFINGVPELNLDDFSHVFNLSICNAYWYSRKGNGNEFKINDDLTTQENDFFQPMRGEITKVFLFNYEMSEEEIIYNFFKCDSRKNQLNESLIVFDWTNVLIDEYLYEFKRKPTSFCQNCKEPELIKHAFMYYDGTKTGDVLLYECQKGYTTIGQSTSVCMVYGSWSHKTPRCKAISTWNRPTKSNQVIQTTSKDNQNSLLVQIVDENSIQKYNRQLHKGF